MDPNLACAMHLFIFRWSKQKRDGTLNTLHLGDGDAEDLNCYEEPDELDIQKVAQELSDDWRMGDWVVVVYENEWYPGIVQEVRIEFNTNNIYSHVTVTVI